MYLKPIPAFTDTQFANFDRKIEKQAGCWLWIGKRTKNGYGRFRVGHSDEYAAHRVAFSRWRGPIPEGLVVDHLCRTRSCVNPAHLEAVTQQANVLRGDGPPAENARKMTCKRGHPYAGPNLIEAAGRRVCRICHRDYHREYQRKLRAAESAT